MRPFGRVQALWPLLAASVAAEIGVRLLKPRQAAIKPDPVEVERYFTPEEVRRGAAFARPQMALALARSATELGALTALVVGARHRDPGSRRRGSAWGRLRESLPQARQEPGWQRLVRTPHAGGALTGAGLAVGMTVLGLPLSAVARKRAVNVGLVTQSWAGWASDLGKQLAIETVMAGGAGAAVVGLTRRYPRTWWLPAAGGSVVLGTLLGALAPVLLDPIFNDFEPLPAGGLRSDVLDLARAAGVRVGDVYVVDASRRTTGANAYVTGLGPTKRVVLFDTLIDRYDRDEIRVVVAHELAHVRNRDILRGVLYGALVAPAAALAVQRLSAALSPRQGTQEALPALALAAALVTAPTAVIGNQLSRALERRADDYSLELSGSPRAFVSFERAVALQNVADVTPPSWLRRVLSTHPPTTERIGAALAYERGATESPV